MVGCYYTWVLVFLSGVCQNMQALVIVIGCPMYTESMTYEILTLLSIHVPKVLSIQDVQTKTNTACVQFPVTFDTDMCPPLTYSVQLTEY